jgi:hypothetical protein
VTRIRFSRFQPQETQKDIGRRDFGADHFTVQMCVEDSLNHHTKHTVLRFLEDGLLEWRDAAPPSSARPVYRITLRSVLELRLGYRVGSATRQEKDKIRPRRRTAEPGAYEVQHLRRKGSNPQE